MSLCGTVDVGICSSAKLKSMFQLHAAGYDSGEYTNFFPVQELLERLGIVGPQNKMVLLTKDHSFSNMGALLVTRIVTWRKEAWLEIALSLSAGQAIFTNGQL